MDKLTCRRCGHEKPISKFRCRERRGRIELSRTCIRCNSLHQRQSLRAEFLSVFGSKCACCGETHPYFLSLEHIKGQETRNRDRRRNGYRQYMQAKRDGWDRTKYECLCMNCNFAKGIYGDCPHRLGVTSERALAELKIESTGVRELLGAVKTIDLRKCETVN